MSNYNDDHNDSAASRVGNLISPGRENNGLPKIREIQLGLMVSALEELAETCLRLQQGASPKDFSALSLILQAKRYSEVSSELGIRQAEAVESAERAISCVKKFLKDLALQKSAAIMAREEYKAKLTIEKEKLKEEYEHQIEKEQNTARDLGKELAALRERLFAVCTDSEARLDYMRSTPIYKLPISYGLQGYLMSAGFETLGDVIKLSKKEVAKVNGITPYLRELDSLVWRSGLDYQSDK